MHGTDGNRWIGSGKCDTGTGWMRWWGNGRRERMESKPFPFNVSCSYATAAAFIQPHPRRPTFAYFALEIKHLQPLLVRHRRLHVLPPELEPATAPRFHLRACIFVRQDKQTRQQNHTCVACETIGRSINLSSYSYLYPSIDRLALTSPYISTQ